MTEKEIFGDLEVRFLDNSEYEKEYITFSRSEAISIICKLIKNAKNIEIFHRPIDRIYKDINKVVEAINGNSTAKIIYHSNFNDKSYEIKNKVFKNINVEYKPISYNVDYYHHKEMIIDNKYLIFGSFNFFTNNTENPKDAHFYLENVCFWIKRGGK